MRKHNTSRSLDLLVLLVSAQVGNTRNNKCDTQEQRNKKMQGNSHTPRANCWRCWPGLRLQYTGNNIDYTHRDNTYMHILKSQHTTRADRWRCWQCSTA